MKNFKGRRMVQEDELKYLQDLKTAHSDPSAEWGGETFTAGEGITIEDATISVNYGAGLTVESETLVIDTSTVALKTDIPSYTAGEGITIDASDVISVDSTVAMVSSLASVATTGDYGDLINTPSIPSAQVNSDWNAASGVSEILNKPSLAAVATTGSYSDLTGTPTIPDAVSGTNDGTNWTSLTVGSDTYSIPAGGSGSSYTFTNGLTESSGTVSWDLNNQIKRVEVSSQPVYGALFIGSNSISGGSNHPNPIVMGNYKGASSSDIQTVLGKCGTSRAIILNSHNWASSACSASGTGFYAGSNNICNSTSNTGASIVVGSNLNNVGSTENSLTIGKFNTTVSNKYLIIGNGTSEAARSNALTVSTDGILECTNIPAVSGTDGTYQLTATTSSGTTTYSWAAGGSGSGKYLHKVKIYLNVGGTTLYFEDVFSSSSSTAYTSVDTFLTDRGYTVASGTDQPTKRLETYATSAITALAYRTDQNSIAVSTITVSSSGAQTCTSWAVESNKPVIIDEVM